jgi:hypothetical protein
MIWSTPSRPHSSTAIIELLAQQPDDDILDVLAEIRSDRHSAAVDARLDLAVEERLSGVLPRAVLPHSAHGGAYGGE